MKSLITALLLCSTVTAFAQQFGNPITEDHAMDASEIRADIDMTAVTKVKGTVQEVCQVKGCWMTMDLGKDRSMRVTFKDYGFFVPTNSSGKTAVLQGQLTSETIDIATLKHFAKDAGMSTEEIEAITEPQQELVFVAEGVLLLD